MGADLYREELHATQQAKYQTFFDEAVKKRNSATNKKAEAKAQKEVEKYYDLMNSVGYFRDSYNNSNLLWKLGLDYWSWLAKHLDKDGYLKGKRLEKVLSTIKSNADLVVGVEFEEEKAWGEPKYFEKKYFELVKFLEGAIKAKDKIACSI